VTGVAGRDGQAVVDTLIPTGWACDPSGVFSPHREVDTLIPTGWACDWGSRMTLAEFGRHPYPNRLGL